ncbi:unnamed protein product, partial [Iphiclides podalirius]
MESGRKRRARAALWGGAAALGAAGAAGWAGGAGGGEPDDEEPDAAEPEAGGDASSSAGTPRAPLLLRHSRIALSDTPRGWPDVALQTRKYHLLPVFRAAAQQRTRQPIRAKAEGAWPCLSETRNTACIACDTLTFISGHSVT